MNKITLNKTKKRRKKKNTDRSCLICWVCIPLVIVALLILDGIGVYPFNKERLIMVGAGILAALFPFFSEIRIENILFKKENKTNETPQNKNN